MSATMRISPLSAYRELLRATRIAFQGDTHTLLAARTEVRKHFDQNRQKGADTPKKLDQALEAAKVLRTNVVQGVWSEDAGENTAARQEGSERTENGQTGSYTLRIHDEIERGDNNTVKINGGTDTAEVKPCSSK